MRRTAVLAVLILLASAVAARAAEPVLELPPPPAPKAAPFAKAAAAKPKGPTVPSELARLRDAAAIAPEVYDDAIETWNDARGLLKKLSGRRLAEMRSILDGVSTLAARRGLTAGRVPVLVEIVRRNREFWSTAALPASGQRVSFPGSAIVWQAYPGNGIQPQWLGTFGAANALWKAKRNTRLRALLDETIALASPRAGGIAWESFFSWSGAAPVWVSGLSQGTAIQALSRAAARFGEPAYFDAARSALGIFRTPPPSGVRVATANGAHYLIYSTNPRLRVLNAFLQSLNGLFDFAKFANDAEGRRLFAEGEAEALVDVPRYDTGAWSLYDGVRESDLGYHDLVRQFLDGLCDRTAQPVFCDTAQSFLAERSTPPVVKLTTTTATAGRPFDVHFDISKVSDVTLRVNGKPVASGRVRYGDAWFRWKGRRKPGPVTVTVDATDLAGNRSSTEGIVILKRAKAKPKRPA